ncbi:glycosyltransferase family 39 protein [Candidatus Woesebacteria bacterium]|nr:glycosyltransferase family 39 protein [Candidatus Woesebacteria bacterium]
MKKSLFNRKETITDRIIHLIKTREFIIVTAIFVFALIVRLYNLNDNIIFAYDQGRDAQRVWDIVKNGDLKIVGPETDIPGVFNGPLFYYILAPIYALSNFDANTAAVFFVVLNASGVILLYLTSNILFTDRRVGYLAGILWAVSYQQLNFARFISNASPMSIATMVFFYGLAVYIFQKKNIGLILSVVGLAAATHFNIYLIYLGALYPFFYYTYSPKIHKRTLLLSVGTLGITLLPWLIAELVWDFSAIRAFLNYFGEQAVLTGVIENLDKYINRISEMSYYSFFSFNLTLAFLMTVIFSYFTYVHDNGNRKKMFFLLTWALSTGPLFAFNSGVLAGTVINSSIFAPFTLIWAAGIALLLSKRLHYVGYCLLSLVIIFNISLMSKDHFQNVQILSHQPLLLGHEKQVVDYTHNTSSSADFSICAMTNPPFVNSVWSHIYKTYGEEKYDRLPFWAGLEQDRNKNHLPYDVSRVKTRYLILEPLNGLPDYSQKLYIYNEDHISDLVEEKMFGVVTVQKRILKEKPIFTDTQSLSLQEIQLLNTINLQDSRYTCNVQYNNMQ